MLANLKHVLVPAEQGKYAVGHFNVVNLEMARGVLEAAEEAEAPVITAAALEQMRPAKRRRPAAVKSESDDSDGGSEDKGELDWRAKGL